MAMLAQFPAEKIDDLNRIKNENNTMDFDCKYRAFNP